MAAVAMAVLLLRFCLFRVFLGQIRLRTSEATGARTGVRVCVAHSVHGNGDGGVPPVPLPVLMAAAAAGTVGVAMATPARASAMAVPVRSQHAQQREVDEDAEERDDEHQLPVHLLR
eukprot:1984883-Pyramimonas_sp.AAC.1